MPYEILVATPDEFDTKPGFNLEGTPDFEGRFSCRNGEIIAHDIVEHCHGRTRLFTINDELEAVGSIWHSRGRWGDFKGNHNPYEVVSMDVSNMFEEMLNRGEPVNPTGKRLRCDAREDFEEVIEISRKHIGIGLRYRDEEKPSGAVIEAYLDAALSRMCEGYNHMNRRFPADRYGRFASNNMFNRIKRAVSKAVDWIDYEGQRFRLFYSCDEAWVKPLEEEPEY